MMSFAAVETAFTVTFGRSGEDNKRFKLGDVENTLQGFAGADYQLQVCTITKTFSALESPSTDEYTRTQ